MLGMLQETKKAFITQQLVDKLDDIVNNGSETVNQFFDNAFFINEQFSASKALKWHGDADEKIVAVPSAFLTDDELQKCILMKEDGKIDL